MATKIGLNARLDFWKEALEKLRNPPPMGQRVGLANPSAGDCMERNQPLAPPYAQGSTRTYTSPVAGHPAAHKW